MSEIVRLDRARIPEFSALVRSVFDEFVAPGYSEEGNRTFYSYIDPVEMAARFDAGQWFFACLDAGKIVGALEVRDGNHIALFFVDRRFQGRGLGRALFARYLGELGAVGAAPGFVEVNSSPYAVGIYAEMGFVPESGPRVADGIEFYPMRMPLGSPRRAGADERVVRYKRTTWDDPDFQGLIKKLDEELWRNYPELQGGYSAKNVVGDGASVVVCYDGGAPVGCGCFRPASEEGVAELKRMFVDESRRGLGLGAGILAGLEAWAAESGTTAMILETGVKQAAAQAMYSRDGFRRTDNYGDYRGNPNSVCMRKELRSPSRGLEGG